MIKLIKLLIAASTLFIVACYEEKHENIHAYTVEELAQHATFEKIKEDLHAYAVGLVATTKNKIFSPTVKEERSGYYVIEFQTSDSNFMLEDVDKNPNAYERNNAMNAAWENKFCSKELKSLILNQNTAMTIEGVIYDSEQKEFLNKQAIAKCDGSNASTIEIIDRGIQSNLNTIQYMTGKMDEWKR